MKKKELLKKGISVGLACMLTVSMIVPTTAEEQTVSDEVVVEQENLESDAEATTDVAEETASVQTAKSANSFEIEGTVLKKYTGTGGAVTIPDSVTEIAGEAFKDQEGITSVKFGKKLEIVGCSAFENCTNLKSVTWNSKINAIYDMAFSGSGITSITIPASVTELGSNAFWWCRNLTDVVYETDADISYEAFQGCKKLKNVTITGNPSCIGAFAFYGNTSLEKINIPNSVTEISLDAFYECESLVNVHLPDSLTEIGDYIFRECHKLNALYMPRSLSYCNGVVDVSSCPNVTAYIHSETTVAIEWAKKNNIRYEIIDESKPYAVESLKAAAYGKNKARLSWDKVENADGYLIYGKHGSDGKYGYIGMTTKNNYYIDKNALDTDYNFYWVYPYKLDDAGKKVVNTSCKYVYAKGICAAVTNLKASSQKGSVKLTWTKSNDAEGYLVYGKTESGKYGYIGMTSKTSYTDKKASKSEYNFYWVYPYYKNADGKMVVGQTGKYVYGKAK